MRSSVSTHLLFPDISKVTPVFMSSDLRQFPLKATEIHLESSLKWWAVSVCGVGCVGISFIKVTDWQRSVPLKLYYYLELLLLRRGPQVRATVSFGYTRQAVQVSTKFRSCINRNNFPILSSFVLSHWLSFDQDLGAGRWSKCTGQCGEKSSCCGNLPRYHGTIALILCL